MAKSTLFQSNSEPAVKRLGGSWKQDLSRRWSKGVTVICLMDRNGDALARYSFDEESDFESLAYPPHCEKILSELIQLAGLMNVCTVRVPDY